MVPKDDFAGGVRNDLIFLNLNCWRERRKRERGADRETDRQATPLVYALVRFIFLCEMCSVYIEKWAIGKPSLGFC